MTADELYDVHRSARGALEEHTCHVRLADCPACDGSGLECSLPFSVIGGDFGFESRDATIVRFCAMCNGSGTADPSEPARFGDFVSDPFREYAENKPLSIGW